MSVSPILSVTGVRHRWEPHGPDVVSIDQLAVQAGESVLLHGPSGCGKSTFLSVMAGVLSPQAGRIEVAGRAWQDMRGAQRDAWRADQVGYIFQQFNLLPYLSVIDNVMLPCRLSRVRRDRARQAGASEGVQGAAQQCLMRLGLHQPMWHRSATELSVGQQQRVAAARALIGSPALIIADEPTSALDDAWRDTFIHQTLQACRAAGSALVVVSHDQDLVPLFDRSHAMSELRGHSSEVPA